MSTKAPGTVLNLTLGGFQTLAEPSLLPFRRLTFLFGPNSAGKSSVEDGLRAFKALIAPETFQGLTGEMGYGNLQKFLRRISDSPLQYAPSLTLGLAANIKFKLWQLLKAFGSDSDLWKEKYFAYDRVHTVEYRAKFSVRDDTDPDEEPWEVFRTGHSLELLLDGTSIIKLNMQHALSINLAHPLLKSLGVLHSLRKAKDGANAIWKKKQGWFSISAGFQLEKNGTLEYRKFTDEDTLGAVEEILAENLELLPTAENLLRLIPFSFDVRFGLVPASRAVPSEEDLLYLFDSFVLRSDSARKHRELSKFPLPEMGSEVFRLLAKSLVVAKVPKRDLERFYDDEDDWDAELSELINKALGEFLFIERGYQVAADLRFLVDIGKIDHEEWSRDPRKPGDFPVLVRMFLVDAQGREFSFDDVGSGLGYVLPVLTSLYGEEPISIIQQPELHLHPALQAAMGDVLIDACKRDKQVIVETHSEHILLRVLKRIRQTTAKTLTAQDLALSPDDISILYFEPSPDGTTRVQQIRVSEDGEFLDRWPRGFFGERDAELFDE